MHSRSLLTKLTTLSFTSSPSLFRHCSESSMNLWMRRGRRREIKILCVYVSNRGRNLCYFDLNFILLKEQQPSVASMSLFIYSRLCTAEGAVTCLTQTVLWEEHSLNMTAAVGRDLSNRHRKCSSCIKVTAATRVSVFL